MKIRTLLRHFAAPAAALVLAGSFAFPASASRSVGVDVWVQDRASYDGEVWIQFAPEHESYVALYGVFSDGSVAPVFPSRHGRGHWVDSCEPHTVSVRVPRGVYLESVQAFASSDWFDPWNCWTACVPGRHGKHWRTPLEVAVAYSYPVSAWSFSLHWDSGWDHACHVGHRVRCDAPPRRLVVTSAGCRSDWKWKGSNGRGRGHDHDHDGWSGRGDDDDDDDRGWNGRRDDDDDDDRGSKNRDGSVVKSDRGKVKSEFVSAERGRADGDAKKKASSEKSSKSRRVSGEPKKGSRG